MVICSGDNGKTGGWCVINDQGVILNRCAMPLKTHHGQDEIDVMALTDWFSPILDQELIFVIEEPLKHAPSAASHSSMGRSFGRLTAWVEMLDHKWVKVDPRHWQKRMLGKVPQGQTKTAALAKAKELQPHETWLATKRSTKPHMGIVDAYLLGEDFRRQQNNKTRKQHEQ